MKRAQIEARLYQLEKKRRSGLLRFFAAIIVMIVLIIVKLTLQESFEWAGSPFASMVLFVCALVCAGFAGYGTRDWRRARNEISALESQL